MRIDTNLLKEILDDLQVDADELKEIAAALRWDLEQGLKGAEYSSLKMLDSFMNMPDGREQGKYIALDFGGTNVRSELIALDGKGGYESLKRCSRCLVSDSYNYVTAKTTAQELFDFVADTIAQLLADEDKSENYYLGHTFSFPSRQIYASDAELIAWTKEFAVTGVVGQRVNTLLSAALERKGLGFVKPVAIINDTVAELLAAGYQYEDAMIGAIYATGSNCCYMEKVADFGRPAGIINLESGGFNKLAPSKWDVILDDSSELLGQQRLEKMVSGRYLGELFSILTQKLLNLPERPHLTAVNMSELLQDSSATVLQGAKALQPQIGTLMPGEAAYLRDVAKAITIRSARLMAAVFAGIAWHIFSFQPGKAMHAAIDGSVYELMPYVQENLSRGLYEVLGEEGALVTPVFVKSGSSLGAAIAAAVCHNGQ
ncbi:MAG: hexokinase [Selenomonadaceae bacterium]|nr:hexokinase [Selenomonadaceae bacterium]